MQAGQGEEVQAMPTEERPHTNWSSDRFTHSSSRRPWVPQVPQLAALVWRFTQPPAQSVVPGEHGWVAATQLESLQICDPAVQMLPHAAQSFGSEVVSLHVGTPPP